MTLQCAILLFQLRKGGYISKGIFCSIFIKVKEISKEHPSLKVIVFTVILKPRLKNQSIYVSTEITDLKKIHTVSVTNLNYVHDKNTFIFLKRI